MRSVIFIPYGSVSQEAGVLALLGRYLNSIYPDVSLLICDGMFSVCDRDAEISWQREPHSCSRCMSDQRNLAAWAGVSVQRLSNYLSFDEVQNTRRWALELSSSQILESQYKGLRLLDLLSGTFSNRLGATKPDLGNKNHEQFLRRISLATLRACIAIDRFNNRFMPNLSLTAGGDDFLSTSFVRQSQAQSCFVSVCKADMSSRSVVLTHPRGAEKYNLQFFLRDLRAMRSDITTWPEEVVEMLRGALVFYGFSDTQLTLPIAR